MPTYALTCDGCGLSFEVVLQRFLRDGDRVCPGCGGTACTQALGGFVTARARRDDPTPRVTGFAGRGCGCAPGRHAH